MFFLNYIMLLSFFYGFNDIGISVIDHDYIALFMPFRLQMYSY